MDRALAGARSWGEPQEPGLHWRPEPVGRGECACPLASESDGTRHPAQIFQTARHFSALLSLSVHSHPPTTFPSNGPTPSFPPSSLLSPPSAASPYLLGVDFLMASLLPSSSCFSPRFLLSSPPPVQPRPCSSVFVICMPETPHPLPQPAACARPTLCLALQAPLGHLRPRTHSNHLPSLWELVPRAPGE